MTITVKGRLPPLLALCLPAIVGTGFFVGGAIGSSCQSPIANVDAFREPGGLEPFLLAVAVTVFGTCYFGASVGPVFLPLAAYQAFGLTREAGLHSRVVIWAWTAVVLGLVAAALFWGWLITLDLFI